MVYADGRRSNDTDLFWALRGGGGGDFAIVTHFHFQIHPQPKDGFATLNLVFPWYHEKYGNVGEKVVDSFYKLLASDLPANWGGYVLVSKALVKGVPHLPTMRGMIIFALLHFGSWEKGSKSIAPLLNLHPEWRSIPMRQMNASTFLDYANSIHDDLAGYTYITNRLIQKSDLVGPGRSKLAELFKKSFAENPDLPDEEAYQCTHCLIGSKYFPSQMTHFS